MSRSDLARLAGVLGLVFAGASNAAVFVNEIHYDDSTDPADVGERIEVVATAGEDLALYSIVLYNGSTPAAATTYDTDSVPTGSTVACGANVRIAVLSYATNGIQNGPSDALALVGPGSTVVQFLSYEGVVTASNGPAAGLQSADIGVSETNSTAAGTSLQLGGNGSAYADFFWTASATDRFGTCNNGQTFGAAPDVAPTVASTNPADLATNVARNANISISFSEPVATTGEWFSISCTTSGPRAVADTSVSGTGGSRTIDPNTDFAFAEDCTVTIEAANVADLDGTPNAMEANHGFVFSTAADTAPTVESFVPANGATNVAIGADITVKFDEAVSLGAPWFTLSCTTSNIHTATVTGGPSQYTVHPDVDFANSESCTFTVFGSEVTDQDGTPHTMAGNAATTFMTSAAPSAYYAGVDASSCSALRSSLHNLIDDHTAVPYTATGQTDTWDVLETADQNPLVSTEILEVYENAHYAKAGGGNANYNREHTWPNSYGFNNLTGTTGSAPNLVPQSSAYVDTHMLWLSDIEYNSNRGSKPYANCPQANGCTADVTLTYNGQGGGAVTYPGNHNWKLSAGGEAFGSYEVWNFRKGEMARAILYMDIRYEGGRATAGNTVGQFEPNLIVTDDRNLISGSASSGSTSSSTTAYMGLKSTLTAWHSADPPDANEQLRNDVVFSFQGNRNPFIDHPEWVAIAFESPCGAGVNQAPVLADVAPSVLENAAAGTVVATLSATDPNAGQTLAYTIVSGNDAGAFALNASSGALTVANAALVDRAVVASYTLVVRATDNGSPALSDDATVAITITPVNDAPSFTKGADVVVAEDSGAASLSGWATAMSAGPSDESAQSVSFEVTANTDTSLFSAAPVVAPNGALSFTPAPDANGTATITLRARDNGGTENGGVDASPGQTFTITITPAVDAIFSSGYED
ncbi:MAG TPA: Ig-like domain-containing protein [Candidatus Saccharimonadia bacterium]|nr:Ig-like domain-containing protein [Candidatus Saccharimonadia bacterium]